MSEPSRDKMDSSDVGKVFTMPALRRPFGLGMLYNCRSDELLCETLWEEDILKQKREQKHESSDVVVLCSDSLGKKAEALDVSGSLKLSLLGGLLDLDGSVKYFSDRKSSSKQQRVILQYKCTTRVDSLTMTHLGEGRVQHPEKLQNKEATHVVTSITYGAQAFFIFDGHSNDSSSDFDLSGNCKLGAEGSKIADGFLESVVRKIPSMEFGGEGKGTLTENEENKMKEFTCIFYGDFVLPQNPSSFGDAVKLYETLPNLLGKSGENAVPIKVQLYPLSQFDANVNRLIRDISSYLINGTECFFEEMHQFYIKCNDLLKFNATNRFVAIRQQIDDFRNLIGTYRGMIQKHFRELLPRVRGANDSETSIEELLKKISMSPFSRVSLRSWLKTKEKDIKVLSQFTLDLSDIPFASEHGDLETAILNPHTKHCLCLLFSLPSHAFQLEAMQEYCVGTNSTSASEKTDTKDVAQDLGSKLSISEVVCAFKDFSKANKANKGLSFIVAHEFSDCNSLNARIEYYRNGQRKSSNYGLPSALEEVKVLEGDTTHDSLTISWKPPQNGASAITSYVVSCIQSDTQVTKSLIVSNKSNQVTINGLAVNKEYEVQVCATLEMGQSSFGKAEAVVRTKPASPPAMLRIKKTSPTEALLLWRTPECVAEDCSVEHYVIKQETSPGHWEEKVCTSLNEPTCKMKVESTGVHVFKVSAFCGSFGHTCDSKPVTLDYTHLNAHEDLKQYILVNSSEVPSYIPKMRKITDDHENIMLELGDRQTDMPEKVILLLGETGSGLNTIIDYIVNYILGVRWEDSFRFWVTRKPFVNQEEEETRTTTSYTIHHQQGFLVPYSITLIETPDFMKSELRKNRIINMNRLFAISGITHIDAVAIVASTPVSTLTPCQKSAFDDILSLLGKDIADNIFLFFPFSDGSESQILGALERAKLPFRKHFMLNSSALYARWITECYDTPSGCEEGSLTASLLWEMGEKSLRLFFEELSFVERKSLSLTREVLRECVLLLETISEFTDLHIITECEKKVKNAKTSLLKHRNIALKPYPRSRCGLLDKICSLCQPQLQEIFSLPNLLLFPFSGYSFVKHLLRSRLHEMAKDCLEMLG